MIVLAKVAQKHWQEAPVKLRDKKDSPLRTQMSTTISAATMKMMATMKI